MSSENIVETDVLVIGGGIAGCFAAVKAREHGDDVTLVEKGHVSRSGQTPYISLRKRIHHLLSAGDNRARPLQPDLVRLRVPF